MNKVILARCNASMVLNFCFATRKTLAKGFWRFCQMDKETIKQQNSMRDVLSRYGMVPNRAGFINCPFHPKDRTASMKIYKDSYYCFGCGATGDIFTFVQNMAGQFQHMLKGMK